MVIRFDVLGQPGCDNAMWVEVNYGHGIDTLLFDCGEACLYSKTFAQIQSVQYLFFSHLHMDHVSGFDTFFRANFMRGGEVHIWGPPGTAEILQGRMRGYWWNFTYEEETSWFVTEIHPGFARTTRFSLLEHFRHAHEDVARPKREHILETAGLTVAAVEMEHKGMSLAYIVREKPRKNLDVSRLAVLGFQPGAWIKTIKDPPPGEKQITIEGRPYSIEELRSHLIVETPGESIAYLTDFLLDTSARDRLLPLLQKCSTIVCESSYHPDDRELAVHNTHMTSVLAAELARDADAGRLVLFHLSSRYTPEQWRSFLPAAQAIFPRANFPDHWKW